jgi:glutamate/tyrosine decarboxylase-like PLP-dependent enzyme
VAEFLAELPRLPVRAVAPVEELERALGGPPPEQGRPFEEVLARAVGEILPNTARVNHPRFFGFIPAPGNPAAPLAEMLTSAWNVFAGTWMGGGAAIVVERGLIRWLAGEFGMGERAGGVMVSGGSHANLTGLAAAREKHPAGQEAAATVYFSDQTHSASERALRALGFRPEQMRRIASDPLGRIEMGALRRTIEEDPLPFCVIANAGTTSTGAVDPLEEMVELCRRRGLWLHADAAYGGGAVLSERGKREMAGLGECDSIAFDPHKWLFQPFDLGCTLVRDERDLIETFHILPAYLGDIYRMNAEINYCDRGLELTRPFRALKLWMSLEHFGLAAFRRAVEHGYELAEHAERRLRAGAAWEILTPAQTAVVTFRHAGDDELQKRLVDRSMASGAMLLTSTMVGGRAALRLCTINPRTTERDVDAAIGLLERLGSEDQAS